MNGRLAIVEDETEVRESVAAMLSTIGLQAESFADAGQFLASVAAGAAYDLCIVDISLPGMRGDDMLVEIGRNGQAPAECHLCGGRLLLNAS